MCQVQQRRLMATQAQGGCAGDAAVEAVPPAWMFAASRRLQTCTVSTYTPLHAQHDMKLMVQVGAARRHSTTPAQTNLGNATPRRQHPYTKHIAHTAGCYGGHQDLPPLQSTCSTPLTLCTSSTGRPKARELQPYHRPQGQEGCRPCGASHASGHHPRSCCGRCRP
jgi:hypothetical protein